MNKNTKNSMVTYIIVALMFLFCVVYTETGLASNLFQGILAVSYTHLLNIDKDTLHKEATKWEIRRGGVSGRSDRQFIDYLKGMEEGTV